MTDLLCEFDPASRVCTRCGYKAARLPTFRACRPVAEEVWRPVKIGDMVERWLKRIGITKDGVEWITRTAGKPGGCGCAARKRWLNDVGDRVQIAARQAAIGLRDAYVGR